MKVVIIEDEHLAAQKLLRILGDIAPGIEIKAIIPSVAGAADFFNRNPDPDLVFMDIQLEDGICFDIFKKTKIEAPVIFITAYDEYTLKAFKQNSIDYLLKPLKKEELENALDKYQKLHQKINIANLQNVLENLKTSEYKERFLVKAGENFKSIELKLVNCFYIKESYAFINTAEGRSYGIDYSLDKIESMVNPKKFFRINRNIIVCFDAIENIQIYSSTRLKLKLKGFSENEDLIVSRERVKAFKEWMDR